MGFNKDIYKNIHEECYQIALKKNNDYGMESLTKYGIKGLNVRIGDKMSRLDQLIYFDTTSLIKEETIEDTAKDIINYLTYLIMISRGQIHERDE